MPNNKDYQAEGAPANQDGQWTTIVRKTRTKKGTHGQKKGANDMISSQLSKAAETRQLIRAMEYTLETGTQLKTMSARQQEVHKQTLQQLKAEASRDYGEVGRLAARVYGTEVKRTIKHRHQYTAALYEFLQTFSHQSTKDKQGDHTPPGGDPTTKGDPEANDGQLDMNLADDPGTQKSTQQGGHHRKQGVEEHKEADWEDTTSTRSTPQRAHNMTQPATLRDTPDEAHEDKDEDGNAQSGATPITSDEGTTTGVEYMEDDETTVYTSVSQQSATKRMQENFEAAERALDEAVIQVQTMDNTRGTSPRTQEEQQLHKDKEGPADSQDLIMELTYVQDKLRMRTEELHDLKQQLQQLRETVYNSQQRMDHLQARLDSRGDIKELQQGLDNHTVTLETLQQFRHTCEKEQERQQRLLSHLDVDQGDLRLTLEGMEARTAIIAAMQTEQAEKLLSKAELEERLQQVIREQLQEQTKQVVKVVFTACRDQFIVACNRIQENTQQKLRHNMDKLSTTMITNMQEEGERIYKTIVEAGEDTQDTNIQMLDAAAATYESEIHDARQAEVTHFVREIQHMATQYDIPNIRQGLLRYTRTKQEQDNFRQQWAQDLKELQQRLLQELESQTYDTAVEAQQSLTREIEKLRKDTRGQQALETMCQDLERKLLTTLETKLHQATETLEANVQHHTAHSTTTEALEQQGTYLRQELEQLRTAQDEWKEYCRQEMKNQVQHFNQTVEQVVAQERGNGGHTTQTTSDTTATDSRPMFRGHPITLDTPEGPPRDGASQAAHIQFGAGRPPPPSENHMQQGANRPETTHRASQPTRRVDWEQQQKNRALMKETQRFKKDEMVFDLPMEDVLPPQKTMEGNYKMFHNSVAAYGFPILAFQDLEAYSITTLPPDADCFYDEETIHLISTAIYLKLNIIIPPMNEQLRVVLRQEADSQDGYRALFGLMRLTCDHLRIIRQPWGPEWTSGMTIHAYFSQLQSKIHNEKRQGRQYTPTELAAEFLQQAIKHPQYLITASHMLTELRGVALQRQVLPAHLTLPNIMATYQNISTMVMAQTPTTPNINKLSGGWQQQPPTIHQAQVGQGDRQPGGRNRPPLKARNAVQCPACMKYGHTVDSQICHFAAQTVHAQQWIQQHNETAAANAQAYKLSKAPRLWNKHIDGIITRDLGFTPVTQARCLYYKREPDTNRLTILLRQVDDFMIAAQTKQHADAVRRQLQQHMTNELNDLGVVKRFNGLDVIQARRFVKIHCETYLNKILDHHGWNQPPTKPPSPHPIPMRTDSAFLNLVATAEGPTLPKEVKALEDAMGFSYRQAIGELLFAMSTCRPDISTATVLLSQHAAQPAKIHYQAVRAVFEYLRITKTEGITYWRPHPNADLPDISPPKPHSPLEALRKYGNTVTDPTVLRGGTDSTWASDRKHRRSVGGVYLLLAGGVVYYRTRIQPDTAQSSTEAELYSMTDAGKAALYLRSILEELDLIQEEATIIEADNKGAVQLSNAHQPTRHTRHVDMKHFVILEWTEEDKILFQQTPTHLNTSDSLSKPTARIKHYEHFDIILGRRGPDYAQTHIAQTYATQVHQIDASMFFRHIEWQDVLDVPLRMQAWGGCQDVRLSVTT